MAKRLSLLFGFLITVFAQFCCYVGAASPSRDESYRILDFLDHAACLKRKHSKISIEKTMQKVCMDYFSGRKPIKDLESSPWMNDATLFVQDLIASPSVREPFYMIAPLYFNFETRVLIPKKTPDRIVVDRDCRFITMVRPPRFKSKPCIKNCFKNSHQYRRCTSFEPNGDVILLY